MSGRRRWLAAALAAALVFGAVITAAAWMFTAGSGGSDPAVVGRANIVGALAGLVALLAVLGVVFRWAAQPRPAPATPAPAPRSLTWSLTCSPKLWPP